MLVVGTIALAAALIVGFIFAFLYFIYLVSPQSAGQRIGEKALRLLEKGKFSEALPLHEKALAIIKKTRGERHRDYAVALNNLGILYWDMGDYEKAEALLQQAVEIRKKVLGERHPEYARSLCNLALVYLETANYEKAEQLLQRTLQIREKVIGKTDPEYAHSLNNLGLLYGRMGQYKKAEASLQEALKIEERVVGKEHADYAECLNNLAQLFKDRGEYEKAEPLAEQAVQILKNALGIKHPYLAASLHNLGNLYTLRSEGDKAETCLKEAVQIRKQVLGERHPYYAGTLNSLALLYITMKEYAKAEPLCKEALAIFEESLGDKHPECVIVLNRMGTLYGCWQKPQLALEHQLDSLYLEDSFIKRLSLWAYEHRLQAYSYTVDHHYDRLYSLLARYFSGTSQAAKESLELHLAYKGRTADIMAARNRLALMSNRPELAKVIAGLKDITRQIANLSLAGPGKRDPTEYKQVLSELEEKREKLEGQLAHESAEYEEKEAAAKVTVDDVAAALPVGGVYLDYVEYMKYDYDAAKWSDERRYLAFLLRRDEAGKALVRIQDLGPTAEINSLVVLLRKAVIDGLVGQRGVEGVRAISADKRKDLLSDSLAELGTQLYEKILLPFEAEIANASVLIISPGGNLNLVPFEILAIPSKPGYLTDHYTVAYCLGRDLAVEKTLPRATDKTLQMNLAGIVAAPNFDTAEGPGTVQVAPTSGGNGSRILSRGTVKGWPMRFDPLPGTLAEGQMIIRKVGKDGVMISGAKANETTVKRVTRPRFLHFATHGFFLEDVERTMLLEETRGVGGMRLSGTSEPLDGDHLKGPLELHNPLLRSGVALAGFNRLAEGVDIPPNEEDGILTAMEVTGLNLYGTELVVLSACDTGLGEVERGEGVAGLRRAFRIAGARNILMSLWSVPDEETMWLMDAFYDHYLAGDLPIIALRKARSEVRERLIERDGLDHPFYWAAFILEGASL